MLKPHRILIELRSLIALTLMLDWLPIRLLTRAASRQACARPATCASRIRRSCAGKPEQPHRILLFVSTGERYVEIIADRETHALAPEGAWKKIVDRFLTTVKAGRVADGVLDAIAACGAILKNTTPPRARRNP